MSLLVADVTLGATGTSAEFQRHPKIEDGVFLGAKCTILGNVTIGAGSTVAAAALVNKPGEGATPCMSCDGPRAATCWLTGPHAQRSRDRTHPSSAHPAHLHSS